MNPAAPVTRTFTLWPSDPDPAPERVPGSFELGGSDAVHRSRG
jgi:hypothetical protein